MIALIIVSLLLGCCNAFFVTLPTQRVISRSDQSIVCNAHAHEDGDGDGKYSLATSSRRQAIGYSMLAIGSTLPLQEAVASGVTEETSTATVMLSIILDPSKPEELSEIEIECRPDWAPLAARRFKELVQFGFYNNCPFFRVLPGFIAQFGIASDPTLNKRWLYCDTSDEEAVKLCRAPLVDEPRTQPNKRGTLSFASSGKTSRRTQIFINTADNSGPPNFLDAQNFVPFARVVTGMEVVKQLNSEYGGKVSQGKAAYYGGEYFSKVFPKLSVIKEAKLLSSNL